jgi:hypothetical protein
MNETKIQIKIGSIEFSGEGNQDWLTTQFDKVLDRIPELAKIGLPISSSSPIPSKTSLGVEDGIKSDSDNIPRNLVKFLKEKDALSKQVRKFLATAAFLQLNGKNRVSTEDVTETLRRANQARLGNASDCLNKNVQKGLCEKDGTAFFVTIDGLEELNIKE